MSRIDGGQLVVEILQRAGVDVLFGINGAHVDTIYQAALDAGLPVVDVRHEMNAGHGAEGHARVRNGLGVAVLTAGGGFTNAITSMANAHLDRTPVLYIAASGPLAGDVTNTLQAGIDQVAVATPVTKWAHRVTRTDLIPRVLARAIRTALSGPRGPVLVDVPWDVLTGEVDRPDLDRELFEGPSDAPTASAGTLDAVLTALVTAERPVVLAGSEVVRSRASEDLRALAELLDVPVLGDYEALGAQTGSPLGAGLVQSLFGLGAEAPDVVLTLGLRFGLNTGHGSGTLVPHAAQVIQVDPDGAELGHLQHVTRTVLADPGAVVSALLRVAREQQPPGHNRSGWRRRLADHAADRRRAVADQAAREVDEDGRIHPYDAVRAVASAVPAGSVVVADGALTYLWLSEVAPDIGVSAYLCHGYLGSMGVGMGIALGAQAADRSTPVVLVTGDGSVGYALGEFDTMVRAGLPVVVVVLNNRAWGATLHAQEMALGPDRVVNNRLENGTYAGVATALGAIGEEVTDLNTLADAVRRAIASGRTTCLDIQVSLDPIPPEERVIMGGNPF